MLAKTSAPKSKTKRKMPIKQKGQYAKPTQDAIKLSTEYDIPPNEAYQVITGREPHPATLKNMVQAVERWSLKHPANLRRASNSIAKFAAGKEVNGIKPKDSTVLAASQRIVDASDPVIKRSENVNVNIQADPVDLSKYRR